MNKENILWNKKQIFSFITPFSLLDFKGVPSAILWLSGCNMRCSFCYNSEIVLGKGKLSFDDIKNFLESRKNLLKGIVLCGGEPTIHPQIFELTKAIKNMGFKIKLDTNGLNPNLLKKLLDNNLIDYVALDFKSDQNNFYTITKTKEDKFKQFEASFDLLLHSYIDYEVRSTIHHTLHTQKNIYNMLQFLENKNYTKNYYLQNFIDTKQNLGDIKGANQLNLKNMIVKSNYSFDIIYRNF